MNRTTQWGGQRHRSSLRVSVTLATAAAIALIAGGKPSEAMAADGTTDVTVQVAEGDENLAWSVPTQIPMKATAAGTLIGPDADAIAIRNLSAFPIRVRQMDTTSEKPFNLVDDVDKSSGNNDFQMSVNGTAAKQTVELPDDGTWAMGYTGNDEGSDKLPLTVSGAKIARVTEDLTVAKKAATITWTVETTEKEVLQEPKPDINGVTFSVYSSDDQSIDFYKRDRAPRIGTQFNGKTVTEVASDSGIPYLYNLPIPNISRSIPKTIEVVDNGIAPLNLSYNFMDFSNVDNMNLIKLDVSNVDSMNSTFMNCSKLANLDLSSWISSKQSSLPPACLQDMYRMFYNCTSLTDITFNAFVPNVTNMGQMFRNCSSLVKPDISFFTDRVTDVSLMFCDCSSLTNLDQYAFWDLSNVTDMDSMFSNCVSLKELNNFCYWMNGYQSNVTNMGSMFENCQSLSKLDIAGLNTSNATNMRDLFYNCQTLTSLDLSQWNTSNVINMEGMFCGCESLSKLDIAGLDTSNVTNMEGMFSSCKALGSLDLSQWNTSNVTKMNNMFKDCETLSNLDVAGLNTSNVTNMAWMFYNCQALTNLDLSQWNTSNVTKMNDMFYSCFTLTSLNLLKWNTSNVTNMEWMFSYCRALTNMDLSQWDTSNVTNMERMFQSCSKLTMDISNWNVAKTKNHAYFNINANKIISPNWNS